MTLAGLLLAGVGFFPVPEVVRRFPDASAFPGVGVQREANMLAAIWQEAEALLTSGPGPGQILARFRRGELTGDERVLVLLGACHSHDLQLVPLYQWAFEAGGAKDKLAAAIGFFYLVGLDPPAPSAVPQKGDHWQELASRARELAREARTTPLARLWVRSYLAASGLSAGGFVFRAPAEACLRALVRVAQPEDLAEVVALWPLVVPAHRSYLVRLLEALTLSRWVPAPPNPQGPTGPWIMETAVNSVDAWVSQLCRTPDGWASFWRRAAQLGDGDVREGLLTVLRQPYPPAWPVAAWHLQAWGAPAVVLERARPDHPANKERVDKLRALFRPERAGSQRPAPAVAPSLPPASRPVPMPRPFPTPGS